MAQHLNKDCGRVIEHCKLGCGIELPRDELEMHVNDECVQRMISCEYCKRNFKWFVVRTGPTLEGGVCRKKVECPFIKYNCEVGLIKRKELNQHLEEKRTEHTELKLSAMEEIVMQQSEMINKQN
ncbi:hypothetical protein LOD99_7103 [Oopsacas minuta]|uniref:TRAF-type domain-containing protein n=1 Tax=Oopsacas minuta TaxID=111878 RepID=A0AAV7JIX4_9METZ|nr:hypothetical protein LOD99_7103 [Oopsacas minuta]